MCENMGKEPINHSKNTKLKVIEASFTLYRIAFRADRNSFRHKTVALQCKQQSIFVAQKRFLRYVPDHFRRSWKWKQHKKRAGQIVSRINQKPTYHLRFFCNGTKTTRYSVNEARIDSSLE